MNLSLTKRLNGVNSHHCPILSHQKKEQDTALIKQVKITPVYAITTAYN